MREKELRLALICYGGVSLAVYMHGITREIWHLVCASRNAHEKINGASGSEAVYQALLEKIESDGALKLRILTDIIAGSSAGGINGIFLSQAIVSGQSLEPLTDLWLSNADVETLLDPDARPLSRFTKFWATPIAWAILRRKGGEIDRTVESKSQDEVASKLSRFVRARWFRPPFGGQVFSGLLFDALDAMAQSNRTTPLLPKGQPLDLFVTVTDFAGHEQELRLNSPPKVSESEHRLTIGFSTRGRVTGDLAAISELVFAARATASFPGAFPPFSARELDTVVRARAVEWNTRDAFLERILPQQFIAGSAADTMLIDGSVLANAPFNQAIDALRNRPARREVDRRFVYIDPKPGRPSFRPKLESDEALKHHKPPGFFATIFGASSDIPREQPIRDSIEKIEGRTERIERMRMVTDALRVEIERNIETMLGKTWFLTKPTPDRLSKWRGIANQKGAQAAGFSYPAYGHLKMVGVVDDMVASARRALPNMANAYFHDLRVALWDELRKRGLDAMTSLTGKGASANSIAFFQSHDVRYRIRRLRFLARELAEEIEERYDDDYPGAMALRDAIYSSLSFYLESETSQYLGDDFASAAANGINNPGGVIDLLGDKRAMADKDIKTDQLLCDALLIMPQDARRTMLLAYLGYPLYDIATLPLLQGEGLDEFDPVKVDRISPEDAPTIRAGGAAATLKGIQFNNFGAFFSRAYRENDYLWGRLHGVDRLIDIVLSSIPNNVAINALAYKKQAFTAILDAEEKRLSKIAPLIASLRTEIAKLDITTE